MEKRPFDGIIFRLREWNHAFDPRPWDEAKLKPQLDDLAAIEWKTFTDNFLCLYAANNWKMDWFDDEQWNGITANLRLSAKPRRSAAVSASCSIPNLTATTLGPTRGRTKTAASPRSRPRSHKRGAQFMTAIQTELPDVRVLTFFHQSLFADLLDAPDVQERQKRLSRQPWALLSAFWNGALDAAAPGVRIIDGYEPAYYFLERELLRRVSPDASADAGACAAGRGRNTPSRCSPAWRFTWTSCSRCGSRPRTTCRIISRRRSGCGGSSTTSIMRWTSDEYVWCYSERMNWWQNNVPDGAEAAIRSAREKIANGQPLGFDIAEIIAAGRGR